MADWTTDDSTMTEKEVYDLRILYTEYGHWSLFELALPDR